MYKQHHPSLIKIDVDGIEHLILRGAKKTLRNETCKSISIEVNENFQIQADEVYFNETLGYWVEKKTKLKRKSIS